MKAFFRRHWLTVLVCAGLCCCVLDAFLVEPHWLKTSRMSVAERPTIRLAHISDIHYKGELSYLARVVARVNQLAPDIVCFTGDIVEDTRYLQEALDTLSKIRAPLYGVPGNHDYWSGASFAQIGQCFRKTGGEWLVDRSVSAAGGRLLLVGSSGTEINTRRAVSDFAMPGLKIDWNSAPSANPVSADLSETPGSSPLEYGGAPLPKRDAKRILLAHYPAVVEGIKDETYDLILSGHAHGGQVRLPFFGALIVPFCVSGYELGTYSTPAGPLHVSSGLGTLLLPVRFFCRPEITLVEL